MVVAPGAPDGVTTQPNPDGNGSVLVGVPISSSSETVTVTDLKDMVSAPSSDEVIVRDSNGRVAPNNTPAATGMIIQVVDRNGNVVDQSTVVVPGDVLGTGELGVSQLVAMANDLVGIRKLTGVYALAGDLTGDGAITLSDVVAAAKMYVDHVLH